MHCSLYQLIETSTNINIIFLIILSAFLYNTIKNIFRGLVSFFSFQKIWKTNICLTKVDGFYFNFKHLHAPFLN